VIQPRREAIGDKGGGGRREGYCVARGGRKPHLIEPATEGRIGGAGVVLLGAKDQVGIGGVAGAASVAIAGVADRTLRRTGGLTVDKQLHGAA
jgi:hypothetical protein